MLGPAKTEALLIPLFDLFLKDLDEVRVGVLRHFAAFLAVLPAARRSSYVSVLDELRTGDQAAWRFRRLAAKQLGALGSLFDASLAQQHLVPLALHLCLDSVAAVRRAAHIHAPGFLSSLPPPAAAIFMQGLVPLANAPYFVHRQAFAALAPAVSLRSEADCALLLPHLNRFVTDPVPNVRLALARALAALAPLPPTLAPLLAPLTIDKDRDVRGAAGATNSTSSPSAALSIVTLIPAAAAPVAAATTVSTPSATSQTQSSTPTPSAAPESEMKSTGSSSAAAAPPVITFTPPSDPPRTTDDLVASFPPPSSSPSSAPAETKPPATAAAPAPSDAQRPTSEQTPSSNTT